MICLLPNLRSVLLNIRSLLSNVRASPLPPVPSLSFLPRRRWASLRRLGSRFPTAMADAGERAALRGEAELGVVGQVADEDDAVIGGRRREVPAWIQGEIVPELEQRC